MSVRNPTSLQPNDSQASAQRALNRGVGLGRASGLCLIVAGAISVLLCVMSPVSVGMLISIAVLTNGVIEWRSSGRLRTLHGDAVDVLALNQISLGVEVGLYAVWRAKTFDVSTIESVLQQPMVVTALKAYPPDQVELVMEMLPSLVRGGFLIGGAVAVLGCLTMAMYYRSRRKHVVRLAFPAARK